MMQQFYEQQPQNNINGFPAGTAFHGSQQGPSSYNGSNSTTTPYRNHNGIPRYSQNENESFESSQNSLSQPSVNYPTGGNYMDPRISGFDPRNHSSYDPQNGMVPGMDVFSQNLYPGKGRLNEMAGMLNNPATMTAFQRQRIGIFGPGSENVSYICKNVYHYLIFVIIENTILSSLFLIKHTSTHIGRGQIKFIVVCLYN